MTMSEARRAALTDKYGINRPPMEPARNTTVQTIVRTEQLEAQAFPSRGTDDYNAYLFDPSRSPRMHAIAAYAHRQMKLGIADGTIDCPNADEDALQVYFVGSGQVRTCKPGRAADRLAGFLRIVDAVHAEGGVYECNVGISDDCEGLGVGTMLMPLLYGGILLVFEVCGQCHSTARELSEVGYRVGEIAAYEDALAMTPQQPARPTPQPARTWWAKVRRWLRPGG
uniref:Uncharacterized protein n=1 Tax=Mycolicibacterium gilvum (strain PYR-GCK) TaxID=350054 RepID=A4T6K0_MYCGI|nr:hypothetical protein Mflv_1979 [Mycolicibacterium gilvum PYR-GCK]